MMEQPQTFSRGKLADFIACQRRYQLRYQGQLTWPTGPLDSATAEALDHGREFHRLLQRHYLGISVTPLQRDAPELAHWWRLFEKQGPQLAAGKRLPEFNLTAPIGRHFLTGRYDLLIVGDGKIHIYDWKTAVRPPSRTALHDDLQTRVYLALAAEGAMAIWGQVPPESISLTYWYASDPPQTRTLTYNAAWHAENWSYLSSLVQQIEHQLESRDELPLTDDLAQCRRCAYQAYCDRQTRGIDLAEWQGDEEASMYLEPDLP